MGEFQIMNMENFFIRKPMTKKDFFALVEKYAKRTNFYLTWDKLTFDEYIDYLMGRELIQENLDILKDNQELLAKLALADERLKNATIELDFPLYHKENLDKEKYWFLYRILPEKKIKWQIYLSR